MKYASEILKNKSGEFHVPQRPALESFSSFLDNHLTLEAASSVANESNALMTGILLDSMGLGESISLESENLNYGVSLEAAKEQNLTKMQDKVSEFKSDFMGWMSKKFSARGKLFSELVDLIKYLEGKEGDINIDDDSFRIDFGGGNVKELLVNFGNTYKTLADLHMTRCSKSVELIKGDSDIFEAYADILVPFVDGMSKILFMESGKKVDDKNVLGKSTKMIFSNKGLGSSTFIGYYIPVDVKNFRSSESEGMGKLREIANLYTEVSKQTHVTFDSLMTPSSFDSPKNFKELLEVVKTYRSVMEEVMDNSRMKAIESLVNEESNLIRSQKKPEAELFARWQMSSSNFSAAKLFFESCESTMLKKFNSLKRMAKAASKK